jgi:hypothetical protein
MANLFFKLLTSTFKFPIFKLTIAIVWNNLVPFYAYITFVATSSIDFGVLVYVVGFSDLSIDCASISWTNLLPNSNSNGNPFVDPGLLFSTCISNGPNTIKESYVSTFSVCSPIACKLSCVCYCYYCYYYKWCCKC